MSSSRRRCPSASPASSGSSTRSSRSRSRTSAPCSRSTAGPASSRWPGSRWRWWGRARLRWGSTGWSTPRSMHGTPAPPDGSSRQGRSRARRSRCCASSLGGLPGRGVPARPARPLAVADPVVMFVVYPYLKRHTWLCHLWLGACLGLAPVGAWVAITGDLPWQAWALGGACASGWPGSTSSTRSSTASTTSRKGSTRGHAVRRPRDFHGARAMHAGRPRSARPAGAGLDVGVWYWLGVAVVLGLLHLRARIVASRRPAPARRGLLHGERRPLDRLLRVRRARHAALTTAGSQWSEPGWGTVETASVAESRM